ncbi:N-6 DNA methylase [Sphingosinicella sp. BN140058]|uniref:N-6 DNA methylase n=1 Tax=Sphingosinicella sp. BN140058 TaxID=1892855 RepID=UPI001010AC31|nr:N-6 DNA methylase [Sphingosinicella sp. BN140058]QAY80179.1 SAM-dependent methyltransferase [Sphingosinicella sp. BN140058]
MTHALFAELDLAGDRRAADIDKLHQGTAFYTAVPEIEALLDRLDWPNTGSRLLDPGAGNGGFVVSALARLNLAANDVATAATRVRGYEIHPGAATAARVNVRQHLTGRGWSLPAAIEAANQIIQTKDFLLSPVPVGVFDVIAANPPYWRLLSHLPPDSPYRLDYEAIVPAHARADLLFAYLQRAMDIAAPAARMGLVTADRWLINSGSAELRERIGRVYSVLDIQRLDASSAFYRPKARTKGTPARVHPVSLILTPSAAGRPLTAAPFRIEQLPDVDGVPLRDLAQIRLAPWLGPEGIFYVRDRGDLPAARLVPCVEPEDIDPATDTIKGYSRWALKTDSARPEDCVVAHIEAGLDAMPKRGRRTPVWLPPERFDGKLPLDRDAVLIPRIAKRLRPILLPAGVMPINHNLVCLAGVDAPELMRMLNDPAVQEQADVLAVRLDGGYRSYTATLLRQLVIPRALAVRAISARS